MTRHMSDYHTSVFLEEAVAELKVHRGKKYIDGTLGGGGHTTRILEAGGSVLGIDVDAEAIAYVEKNLPNHTGVVRLVRGNFRTIDTLAKEQDFYPVSGVLFDLGVSSHQFDTADRGFSIMAPGPLDMRMDQRLSVSAKDLVNGLTRDELSEVFFRFGEERFAKRISQSIVDARKIHPIETTGELALLIKKHVPHVGPGIHPATRVFQALRIAVNDELYSLEEVLPKALNLLESEGRIVIITFHSLEDRIVKHAFLQFAEKGYGKVITKKPILPREEEIVRNPRSRSAKLRVFEKHETK